jgi:hypothetical protein
MSSKQQIKNIVNIMEMMDTAPDVGMGSFDTVGTSPEIDMQIEIIPNQSMPDEQSDGYHANDYLLAKQLLVQVGSIERVRQLFSNLEQVLDTLNLKDDQHVGKIAQCCDEI